VGKEAKEMVGKTPENIQAIRPLRDGVITDFEITQVMLSYFIKKALGSTLFKPKPRVVIAEPMAAAIGADLPVDEPIGNMVVDIGGGTTEIAVISLAGIVVSNSLRIAGDEMNEAIIQYIKRQFHILIGEQTAEKIKIELGSAVMEEEEKTMEIRGRDMTGLPKTIEITNHHITEALEDTINSIINAIRVTLERTPPELAADIADKGIVLAGGGALLNNMDDRIQLETGIKAYYCEEPLIAVARGVGRVLDNLEMIRRITME